MTQRFLVDKILHAFLSDGNLHVVLGLSTGLVNEKGDIKEPQVTIIIPSPCASEIKDELSKAIAHFKLEQIIDNNIKSQNSDSKIEILGPAIDLILPGRLP